MFLETCQVGLDPKYHTLYSIIKLYRAICLLTAIAL